MLSVPTKSRPHQDKNSTVSRGVPFFGTFYHLDHDRNLDFYRVLYDAKEKKKENDDNFLEMTPTLTT